MSSAPPPLKLKCVIVGDSTVGKTSCLTTYTLNTFSGYVPVMDFYTANLTVDNEPVTVEIYDTQGENEMDKVRPLAYPGTDVFLIAFSVVLPTSFTSVGTKWIVELKQHMPDVPFLLVGMKTDLRTENMEKQLVEEGEARRFKDEIGAKGYYECSSLTKEGLQPLFEAMARVGQAKKALEPKKKEKKKSCTIL